MHVRINSGVYIRHIGDESVVWCPRSSGCTVLRNCRPFLQKLGKTGRSLEEIEQLLVDEFGEEVDFRDDFAALLEELISQGFVSFEEGEKAIGIAKEGCSDNQTGQETALSDFCIRHGIPAELHIDLTDACTEQCLHCYVPSGQRHYLPFGMIEKALREFRQMNGLTVHLTGGEAMMHPDFERVCRLCVGLDLNLIVFSNMTLCDERRVCFLKEVDPQFVNVSLYSMDAEEHDKITRLPGSWKRTMDATLLCNSMGVQCRIAVPVLKANKNSLQGLSDFANRHKMVMVPSCEIVAKSDHGCDNLVHACSASDMHDVMKSHWRLFQNVHDSVMPRKDKKVCGIGDGRLYLSAQGNYYPCDSMHEYVLGNVRENTIGEIWKGEKLNYLRSLKNCDFGTCATCENRPWCKVCPAANFNATGDLFTHHPNTCALAGVVREVYEGM